MANKDLTARVRLDITDVERKIARLEKLFRNLNRATNNIDRGNRLNRQLTESERRTRQVANKTREWEHNQKRVTNSVKSTNSALGSVGSKLKHIAATYLGIMGAGAMIRTSDIMTSSQNKLDYLANQNGGGADFTTDAMDKMYVSSQKVRMSYADMMTNVSKSMTLAGKSFDNNIDNAIRFQEIMAESYAIGGATAAEMHSSMYQMIQALGAGILAGDELRSVREGAPLAYKAIEEFAQGIYNTDESLKELASQGKITSDIVVAAILNAGNEVDTAFAQTAQTFAQTWTQIKNAAQRAFLPVSNMLRDALNKAIDNGMIEKVESFFTVVSKGLQIIYKLIEKIVIWIADNWDWLKWIAIGVIVAIIGHLLIWTTVAIKTALARIAMYIAENKWLLLIAATITALIWVFVQWKNGAIDTCTAITYALLIVAAAALVAWLFIGGVVTLVIAAAFAVLAACVYFFEYINGAVQFICAVIVDVILIIWNIFLALINFIVACISWVVALIVNSIQTVINFGKALGQNLSVIATNIGIAFQNAWAGITSSFWNMIADLLDGLACLEGPINAILSAFDKDPISISGIASNLRGKGGTKREYQSLPGFSGVSGFEEGWSSKAWNKGMNTFEDANLINPMDAYNSGYDFGIKTKDHINNWASQFQTGFDGFSTDGFLDNMGEKLGLDFSKDLFPDGAGLNAGNGGLGGLPGDVGDIADNTGSMVDAMDLTEEDLEYLRKLAAMEWKKEYTTANITVDMSNYNTISGETDLDGIVTRLADKVYEEMDYLANGVYA